MPPVSRSSVPNSAQSMSQGLKRKRSSRTIDASAKKSKNEDSEAFDIATISHPSLGTLSVLPKEIRQEIFYAATYNPHTTCICVRPDAGITNRLCPKHNNIIAGKYNILSVSKEVNLEASWVVFNRSKLRLDIEDSMSDLLGSYKNVSIHRLGELPTDAKVNATWHFIGRFRTVNIRIRRMILTTTDPIVYSTRLLQCASLLLASWQVSTPQPSSDPPHTVTIDLGSLFGQPLPFNADVWGDLETGSITAYHNFLYEGRGLWDFSGYRKQTGKNLTNLIKIIGSNRGDSEWIVRAYEPSNVKRGVMSQNDGSKSRGMFKLLEDLCDKYGVKFVKISR